MKRKREKYLCKDITGRKIYFALQEDISSVYEEALAFVKKIFGTEAVYLSDESSLSDFVDEQNTMNKTLKKIKKVYGLNVYCYKNRSLFEIVKRVLKQVQ